MKVGDWKEKGYCGVHSGPGKHLNVVHPSGLVAQFYGLTKNTWVCENCWNHSIHSSNQTANEEVN